MRRSGGLQSRAACSMTILWGTKDRLLEGDRQCQGLWAPVLQSRVSGPFPPPASAHFLLGPGPPPALQAPTSSCRHPPASPELPSSHVLVPARSAGSLRPLQGCSESCSLEEATLAPRAQTQVPDRHGEALPPHAKPRGHGDTVGAAGGPRRCCTPTRIQKPWVANCPARGCHVHKVRDGPHTSGPARGP